MKGAATYLLMHISRLLILKHLTRKFKASILYPSPFTAMSTYVYGRSLMLTPVLVRYKHMAEAWHTATTEQKMLIEKYRLAQTF